MKILMLNGHGISMRVDSAKLIIKEGRYSVEQEPQEYIFAPKMIPYDNIIIYGQSGQLSLEAIRWLIKHNIQVTILDWNGKLLTTMLPPESVTIETKFCQYKAYENDKLRLEISKEFIRAKFKKSEEVLKYLKLRYVELDWNFSDENRDLLKAKTLKEIMQIEARAAAKYWREIKKVIPLKYEFVNRKNHLNRPKGASDKINALFNYGYSILEAECLRCINSTGLDPHIGFLHHPRTGKKSLAYDLQELFRFLVDLTIVSLVENDSLKNNDFIRTENYTLKLRPSGAKKLLEEFNKKLNETINYENKDMTWSYVMLIKAREFAHFLLGKKRKLNLTKPNTNLTRDDTESLRDIIQNISYTQWKELGFSKGTLHYLKQNASTDKPFTMNSHVKERIMENYS